MKKLFKKHKKLIVSILLLIILAAFSYWAYLLYQNNAFQAVDTENSTTNQTNISTDVLPKEPSNNSSSTTNNVDTSKNTAEIPVSSETTVEISQLYQDGNNIVYKATVTNPGATGTCSADFTKTDSKPVTQVNSAVGGVCGPITFVRANFDMRGIWLLTLRYYNDNTQAIATKTIEIK